MTNTKISVSVRLTPKNRLNQALKEAGIENPATVSKLTVSGTLDYHDFGYIRAKMNKTLQELDMSKATIEGNVIGEWFFRDCSLSCCPGLISVIIPDSVVEIGKWAFSHCSGLTSVYIPDSVVAIGDDVFLRCSALKSVNIPRGVAEIGEKNFSHNVFVTVHPDNPTYTSVNGKLALKEIKIVTGQAGDLQWTLADSVLTISGNGEIPDYDDYKKPSAEGQYTEEGRSPWYPYSKHVKKIVFKGNIRLKGLFAFCGCQNLNSVTFNDCTIPHFYNRSLDVNDIIVQPFKYCTLTDVRNFKSWFSYQIPFVIQEFKRKAMGHPGHMTSQEWNAILDRMTFCFSEMQKPFPTSDDEIKARENIKNEGFKLMNENFFRLWW